MKSSTRELSTCSRVTPGRQAVVPTKSPLAIDQHHEVGQVLDDQRAKRFALRELVDQASLLAEVGGDLDHQRLAIGAAERHHADFEAMRAAIGERDVHLDALWLTSLEGRLVSRDGLLAVRRRHELLGLAPDHVGRIATQQAAQVEDAPLAIEAAEIVLGAARQGAKHRRQERLARLSAVVQPSAI
ncbi:MAG: hypothetical protein QM756_34300 [Polyangiaceae bacterium]